MITGLAVGFGDIHPETDDNVGYVFTFFYSFILVIYTYRVMATLIKSIRRPSNFKAVLTSTFDPEMMASMDRSDDNVVGFSFSRVVVVVVVAAAVVVVVVVIIITSLLLCWGTRTTNPLFDVRCGEPS